jgi:hypothetical protein
LFQHIARSVVKNNNKDTSMFEEYIGLDVDEAVKEVKASPFLGFRTVQKAAEGETYKGQTFEVVLVRYNPSTRAVTRIGPAYNT